MSNPVTKEDVVSLACSTYGWTRTRVLSWYKLESRWLGNMSPHELVLRGEGQEVVDFLRSRKDLPPPKSR